MLRLLKLTFSAALKALSAMIKNDGLEHAGNLAFLSLVSFLPFLLFFFSIAGHLSEHIAFVLGSFDINQYFLETIANNLPEEAIRNLYNQITEMASSPPIGLVTLIAFSAVWISSSLVEGLRSAFNKAYRVQSPPIYVLRRLLSIAHCVLLTCILVITVLMFAALSLLRSQFHVLEEIWPYLRYCVIPLMLFVGISLIYFIVPNTKNSVAHIFPGAFVVVILWNAAAVLFIEYVNFFKNLSFSFIYGSIGSNILFLIFFYILHICLIYGAEFNSAIKHTNND